MWDTPLVNQTEPTPSPISLVPPLGAVEPETIYQQLDFPPAPRDRPYVVLNMVSSMDGKVTLGTSGVGLGSRLDFALMRRLRMPMDAVMHGAGTIRADRLGPLLPDELVAVRMDRGQPPRPYAITISRTLGIDPSNRFFREPADRTIVLTTQRASRTRGRDFDGCATLLAVGEDQIDLPAALARLRHEYGIARLLCEGGARLNQSLLDANAIDELFWTIAPKLAGGSAAGLIVGADPPLTVRAQLELIGLIKHGDELFTRYRVRRPACVT